MADRYYNAVRVIDKHLYGYESERFEAYFWFVGWHCLSLGFHVCVRTPNIELHIPFGFIRIGRQPNPDVFRERQQYLKENPLPNTSAR